MRKGFLGSLLVFLAGAGVAAAQSYYPTYRAPAYPGWQYPQTGYYNSQSVPPQIYPTWPNSPTLGVAYAAPYPGQPQMPNYAPQTSSSVYQVYPWPGQTPSAAPPPRTPLPAGPPATPPPPIASPTPAPSSAPAPQPVLNLSDGLVPPPPPQVPVAVPKTGTQLLQNDPVGDCPGYVAAPSLPPSHEYFPPFIAPKGYCLYGNTEALSWWIKRQEAPPLLSTGPLFTPDNQLNNTLGFGDQQHWGGRGTLGFWIVPQQQLGLEMTGFFLVDRTPTLSVSSPAVANFGNPFVSAATGTEALVPVANGAALAGSARIETPTSLWGLEGNLRKEVYRSPFMHIDLLAGCRYVDLQEGLELTDESLVTSGAASGSQVASSDRFRTHDQFLGGQLGADMELHQGRFFFDLWGKIAVGGMNQDVSINGTTLVTTPAGVATATPGGVYAQGTNSGDHSRLRFSAIPEVGVNVGMQLTSNLRASVGYSFLYLADVVRPGDQIDRTVNLSQQVGTLVGPARPLFSFNTSDFWAQGISVGLEFRY